MSHRHIRRAVAVLCAVIAVGALTGCIGITSQVDPAAEKPAVAASQLKPMTIEQKQTLIAENFQAEVPVPMGEVVAGRAQGDLAWDYELLLPEPPASVATWYAEALSARDWEVVSEAVPSEGAITLTMVKNAAQTRITITPEPDATSRVKVILGVGVDVLQSQ
ncbi:MAG: hypothetical protein HGB10_07935 [Coriobacteriia bacterium]|nr:hypothetical protein [Coriobacteriia bacterium]